VRRKGARRLSGVCRRSLPVAESSAPVAEPSAPVAARRSTFRLSAAAGVTSHTSHRLPVLSRNVR
jgi:hypothetical protein